MIHFSYHDCINHGMISVPYLEDDPKIKCILLYKVVLYHIHIHSPVCDKGYAIRLLVGIQDG